MQRSSFSIFAASVMLLVVACAEREPPGGDARLCGTVSGPGAVFVLIDHDGGAPVANPAVCHVRQGTKVLFKTKPGAGQPFRIKFTGNVTGGSSPPPPLDSEPQPNGGQQLKIEAKGAPGTYDYRIESEGIGNEPRINSPVIIIDR